MSKKTIEKLIKWSIYATFFVPLVVVPSSFIFPFIVPKILLFRSLTILILALYSILLFVNWEQYRPRVTPLTLAVGVFYLSFVLSTFFGTDTYHSFWDNHERMLGLFTITHYIIYYLICSQIFKTWSEWKMALNFFLLAGSLVMLVGLLQVFNPTLLLNGGSNRVIATLGNAIYVGGYGLFLMFVSGLLFLKESSRNWKFVYVGGGLLGLAGLIFSGTRGTMLGLFAGIGFAVLCYIFALKNYPKIRRSLIGLVVAGIALVVIGYAQSDSALIKRVPVLDRVFNTTFSDVLASPRFLAWRVGIEAWKERPLFGWGPNNYFYAFNTHYNPKSLDFGYGETWFDNAHNILVNTLTVQGVLGLISYLSIFAVAGIILFKGYKNKRIEMHFAVITASFLVAHLVQNITVFENPTSYLYFVFWLALINSLASVGYFAELEKDKKLNADKKITSGILTGTAVGSFIVVFIFNIQPARANMKTLEALQMVGSNPALSIPAVEGALNFNSPHIDDIRNDLSRTIIGVTGGDNKLDAAKKKELNQIAEQALIKNIELHPLDIRVHMTISQLFQNEAVQNNSAAAMMEAERYMGEAYRLSPKRQQVIFNLAVIKAQLGRKEEAIKLLEQAINDNPRLAESYIRLAYLYNIFGENEKAKDVIDLANQNSVVFSETDKQTINQIIPVTATK